MLLSALVATAHGQDRHDWQSVSQLHAGDRVRLSSKTGRMNGLFQNWTPQELTVGTVTTRREDVLKIERYRHGGLRSKHIVIGALIGFGGGFAIGADGRPCFCTGPQAGVIVGGAGAVVGGLVGAILPARSKELIYSTR